MEELWRSCVHWLVDTGVLPRQHKTTFPSAVIFDLAQTLRDGVVLCNLLNAIQPGAVDLTRINIRPQMLQFLCIQNLHTVLHSLQNVFGIPSHELFEAPHLYEMTNFRQVLRVLSILSYSPIAIQRFRPFPTDSQPQSDGYRRDEEEDIYAPLADLASERELIDEEEDLYDSVPEAEDSIYGSMIDIEPCVTHPKDKRTCCINEMVETERNYVNHLDMMKRKFITPLRNLLDEKDIKTLFANTEQLLPMHQELLTGIENAVNNSNSKLSIPLLKAKNNLLQYGTYCSNLTEALSHLAEMVQKDQLRMEIDTLQNLATPNKFKLRELLCVSMQRILKYHLLVRELYRQTNESHADKSDLSKTLEAMQEVAQYINEVKRDSEMLHTINKVEACLVDYQTNFPLHFYGRLLKDGDLKIKGTKDKRPQTRFTYLFDQALFMTQCKNEVYKLTDLLRLEDFRLDENPQTKATKWAWSWTLRDKYGSQCYTLHAKTTGDKQKWIEKIHDAFDNIRPNALKGKDHSFKMSTFEDPTYCDQCDKLLLGCFFQGYKCERTNKVCHKECLLEAWKSFENDGTAVGKRNPSLTSQSPALPAPPGNQLQATYTAHRDYNGQPPPPFPTYNVIKFNAGEQIEVIEQKNADWWMGRAMSQYDRTGYFPASYVSPFSPRKNRVELPVRMSYEQATPGSNFGPNVAPSSPQSNNSFRLEDFDWYAGTQDRLGAEKLLRGKPSGTYLVRTREGHFAITLVFKSDMKHIKIFETPENMLYVAECKNFSTVPELVKYYQSNMLSSSFFGLETSLITPYRSRRQSASHLGRIGHPPAVRPQPPGPSPSVRPLPSGLPSAMRPQPGAFRPNPNPNSHISPNKHSNGSGKIHANGQLLDVMSQGRVMYDFDPQSPQELGLRVGQVVNIISKPDGVNGWWKGEYQSRVGYFPAKFVQELV